MSRSWHNDDELFALARGELFSAVVGDIMDEMGLYHQFLPPQIRPLDPRMVTIGRAMTVLQADYDQPLRPEPHNLDLDLPFGRMLDALDNLKPNEVYVATGATAHYALWGELMSTRAGILGAAGAVLNGYSRDTPGTLALNFPTFAYGSYAQDQAPRGRVIDFRVPVMIIDTVIDPGDIIFGDIDGVCVVPRQAEDEVFARALEKARGEKTVKRAIEAGMSAREAFERYRIM